ncbi:AAA family ATPase [Roseiconus lacunae]|uniref:AAA family ATPase n=1 Tax=Roseiconus lacunae TaxID=2605694 RepID=UPI0011F1DA73|nr:AAA family ATPase [Roseiconus lacunae]
MSGTWWVGRKDLDDDQKKIFSIPESESFLITGPPGSGKTNLLLLRANYLHLSGFTNIAVVTFTRPLCEFISTGASAYDFPSSKIVTCSNLLSDFLRQFGGHVSRVGKFEDVRNRLAEEAAMVADQMGLEGVYDAILLDEAQDYLPNEIKLFRRLAVRLCAVADGRQKIYSGDDSESEIGACVDKCYPLRYHYRIGRSICQVADEIAKKWNGYDPLTEFSNYVEDDNPSTVNKERCDSLHSQAQLIIKRLKTQLSAFPGEYLGVLCPKKEETTEMWNYISQSSIGSKATLLSSGADSLDLEGKQIIVSTFHGSKGLEFRATHLAACESLKVFGNNRKMAFTVVTRTKTALSVYHTDDLHPYFESALTANNPIHTAPSIDACFGGGS